MNNSGPHISWAPYALVRVVFFFVVGILSGVYLKQYLALANTIILLSGLILSYILLWLLARRKLFYKLNPLLTAISYCAFFFLGYLNITLSNASLDTDHILKQSGVTAYRAVIKDDGQEKKRSFRYLAEVTDVKKDSVWCKANGKVYLYQKKEQKRLAYGSVIVVSGAPQELTPPQNPGEFDYKRFLTFQNIYHQHFVGDKYHVLDQNEGNAIFKLAYNLRRWAVNTLSNYIDSERERNIAIALIVGVKDGLNNEVKNAYSASGAMHVLAVSGLHVGIVYGILLMLLRKFQNDGLGRWLVALLSLAVLWGYAMITGFSPSVLRAVTMFSFVALAKASGRKTNIYNTLAASALCILLFDPFLIMSVGFQLSYLAVFGIVLIQPMIYRTVVFNNTIMEQIWMITSVSIAAQLATFPLGFLYFHQFPVFFLFSNLVVIPGAFLMLILGLILLAVSGIPKLAALVGFVLKWIIFGINEVVFFIEDIPFGQLKDVYITTSQSWIILAIVGCVILTMAFRHKAFLIAGSAVFIILIVQLSMFGISNAKLDKITFYRVNKHTAIDFIHNYHSSLWTDSVLYENDESMRFHIKPNYLRSGVSSQQFYDVDSVATQINGFRVMNFRDKAILLLDQNSPRKLKMKVPIPVDYIVCTDRFRYDLKWVQDNFTFDKLILDGSLSSWNANFLKQKAEELSLPYYSVYHDGAFEVFL